MAAFIFSGYFTPAGFGALCPCACLLELSSRLRASSEIARNGLLLHSLFDIISIRTSGANQDVELEQGKLRCLKGFHNTEKKLALNSRYANGHECKDGRLRTSASTLVNDSQKSCQLFFFVATILSLSFLPSISHEHNSTVKRSLTQKCQGMRLHLAAVVYNAL